MKNLLRHIFIFLLFSTYIYMYVENKTPTEIISLEQIPIDDRLAYEVVGKVSKQFKKEYDLDYTGAGLSGNEHQIEKIRIIYFLKKNLSKDECRKLIMKCGDALLYEINHFEEIKPFLSNNPFTIKNIDLAIHFCSEQRENTSVHPDICVVSLMEGFLCYSTNDPEDKYQYKSRVKESFEEALKTIEETSH